MNSKIRLDTPEWTAGLRAVTRVAKTGGRHAAITNSLYNWHSYKNWAEKARGNFDEKK